jgi:hypothetical protein
VSSLRPLDGLGVPTYMKPLEGSAGR